MFEDLHGNMRQKVALHQHTTLSDGKRTPEEVLSLYREKNYDAVALTDHWHFGEGRDDRGLTVLSGIEYNIGARDGAGFTYGAGVYHIVAVGCKCAPALSRDVSEPSPKQIADAIHAVGGLAVLAHPAWSLNDPAIVAEMPFFDATEIYNTVSGVRFECRPDASSFVDLLACRGMRLPLLAVDDAHYYGDFGAEDGGVSFVCVQSEKNDAASLCEAIRQGRFYASQGPQVLVRREGDELVVDCTPCVRIAVISNLVYIKGRVLHGENLTQMRYKFADTKVTLGKSEAFAERFARVEVTDAAGLRAWTNFIER